MSNPFFLVFTRIRLSIHFFGVYPELVEWETSLFEKTLEMSGRECYSKETIHQVEDKFIPLISSVFEACLHAEKMYRRVHAGMGCPSW